MAAQRGSRAGRAIPFRARPRSATISAPKGKRTATGDAKEAAEALTLLDALARAPAAAALVVAARGAVVGGLHVSST